MEADKIGWGTHVMSWVQLLYGEQQAVISVQGYTSRKIRLTRGVRQGCPLFLLPFQLNYRNSSYE